MVSKWWTLSESKAGEDVACKVSETANVIKLYLRRML
jgi:hypothetical protein